MNKIKFLYDVVKTMKEKEVFKGTLKAVGEKNHDKVVTFINNFEKNLATGQVKAEISSEVDYEGKIMKHQSKTEFEWGSCHKGMFGALRHRHHHGFHGAKCRGIKGRLDKVAFFLKVLNELEINEENDKKILAIRVDKLPEGIKEHFHRKMHHKIGDMHHNHKSFIKEIHALDDASFELKAFINSDNEIENIKASLVGEQNECDESYQINLKAELELNC